MPGIKTDATAELEVVGEKTRLSRQLRLNPVMLLIRVTHEGNRNESEADSALV